MDALPDIPLLVIAHIIVNGQLHHFVVIYKVEKNKISVMDPAYGKMEESGIYKNYKTGEYLSGQSIVGRDFYIKDKVVKYDWKLTNETKKIGNFNAKKATATYDGKQVEAWYAEEIPMSGYKR